MRKQPGRLRACLLLSYLRGLKQVMQIFTNRGKRMHILSRTKVFEELCRSTGKWGMYIHFCDDDDDDSLWVDGLFKAAPYLDTSKCSEESEYERICNCEQICSDGWGIFLFDTEEEMDHYYQLTVGDDGPTKLNNYNGPFRVFALTCDPTGQLLTENT